MSCEPLLTTEVRSSLPKRYGKLFRLAFFGSLFLLILGFILIARICLLTNCQYSPTPVRLKAFRPKYVISGNSSQTHEDKSISRIHLLNPSRHSSHSSSLHSLLASSFITFDQIFNNSSLKFNVKAEDVIVFLHIQKTGGTSFGRHLVHDLDLEVPCKCSRIRKQCRCRRPHFFNKFWLFSRFSMGWECGLHADWTELRSCVDDGMNARERTISKRRYYFITILRQPVLRFISEFRHVQRGATWGASRHWCGGRTPTIKELPSCYSGPDWADVDIEEFMACKDNLAINRMTRMLADLSLVHCYNKSVMSEEERDRILLESAKSNLQKMPFFGLCEEQKKSQYLFESTFGIHFVKPFIQLNETLSTLKENDLSKEQIKKIIKLNSLDMELYQFALNILKDRFEIMKNSDIEFDYQWNNLGSLKSEREDESLNDNEDKIEDDDYDDYDDYDEEAQEVKVMRKVARRKMKILKSQKKSNKS